MDLAARWYIKDITIIAPKNGRESRETPITQLRLSWSYCLHDWNSATLDKHSPKHSACICCFLFFFFRVAVGRPGRSVDLFHIAILTDCLH